MCMGKVGVGRVQYTRTRGQDSHNETDLGILLQETQLQDPVTILPCGSLSHSDRFYFPQTICGAIYYNIVLSLSLFLSFGDDSCVGTPCKVLGVRLLFLGHRFRLNHLVLKTCGTTIRTCYLGHVTDYQPIRDQHFLIQSNKM